MASKVQIIIDTTLQAAGLKEAKGGLETLGKTAQTQGKMLSDAKTVITAALGTAGILGAVVSVGEFVKSSVTDWADYADSMRLAANTAGMSVDSYSRLVQVADDVRVKQESLTRALQMAQKNGLDPSINSIAELADQLNEIRSPSERAALAAELFGRNWAEIDPLLRMGGDAIREATAAVGESLVVTEQAAQAAKAYKDMMDELGDSFSGVKYQLAQGIVPALVELFNVMQAMAEISPEDRADKPWWIPTSWWDAGSAKVKVYNDNLAEKARLEQENRLSVLMHYNEVRKAGEVYKDLTQDITFTAQQMSGVISYARKYDDGMKKIAENRTAISELNTIVANGKGEFQGVAIKADDARKKIAELSNVNIQIEASFKSMANQMALSMLQAELAVDGFTATEVQVFFDTAVAMGETTREGADAAVGAMLNAMKQVSEMKGEPTIDIDKALRELGLLDSWQFETKTIPIALGSVPNMGGVGTKYTPSERRAGGGPVNRNRPYLVGEEGPELYVPHFSGTIIPNEVVREVAGTAAARGPSTFVFSPNVYNQVDLDAAFERFVRMINA